MALPTMHDSEYYFKKAEDSRFLKRVVEGTDSLEGRLDLILFYQGEEPEWFAHYLDTLEEMTGVGLHKGELMRRYEALYNGGLYIAGNAVSTMAAVIGAAFLAVPPFVLLEPILLGLGAVGYLRSGKNVRYYNETFNAKETIFNPVRFAASACDLDIGRCFLYGDFMEEGHRHDRFEKTYAGLEPEERSEVRGALREMLAAGALDMGEAQLDSYFAGLGKKLKGIGE